VSFITDPLSADFVLRALAGGAIVSVICGVVGVWVVVRGMAFLGEAIGHGMLPGVALATVLGISPVIGGFVSAAAMSVGISLVQRRGRISADTSIGLLFVAMLSLGVIIVSHSGSFATDVTAILFGDILAITPADLVPLTIAAVCIVAIAIIGHRSFVAASFDERVAQTMRLHPRLARAALVGLVTVAVVASAQAVGTLLVVGLLLGPAVAAAPWTGRLPIMMALASIIGMVAVLGGLLLSWHAGTAASASIAACAVLLAALSALARSRTRALTTLIPTKTERGRR